jgi:hypothetical protein
LSRQPIAIAFYICARNSIHVMGWDGISSTCYVLLAIRTRGCGQCPGLAPALCHGLHQPGGCLRHAHKGKLPRMSRPRPADLCRAELRELAAAVATAKQHRTARGNGKDNKERRHLAAATAMHGQQPYGWGPQQKPPSSPPRPQRGRAGRGVTAQPAAGSSSSDYDDDDDDGEARGEHELGLGGGHSRNPALERMAARFNGGTPQQQAKPGSRFRESATFRTTKELLSASKHRRSGSDRRSERRAWNTAARHFATVEEAVMVMMAHREADAEHYKQLLARVEGERDHLMEAQEADHARQLASERSLAAERTSKLQAAHQLRCRELTSERDAAVATAGRERESHEAAMEALRLSVGAHQQDMEGAVEELRGQLAAQAASHEGVVAGMHEEMGAARAELERELGVRRAASEAERAAALQLLRDEVRPSHPNGTRGIRWRPPLCGLCRS